MRCGSISTEADPGLMSSVRGVPAAAKIDCLSHAESVLVSARATSSRCNGDLPRSTHWMRSLSSKAGLGEKLRPSESLHPLTVTMSSASPSNIPCGSRTKLTPTMSAQSCGSRSEVRIERSLMPGKSKSRLKPFGSHNETLESSGLHPHPSSSLNCSATFPGPSLVTGIRKGQKFIIGSSNSTPGRVVRVERDVTDSLVTKPSISTPRV